MRPVEYMPPDDMVRTRAGPFDRSVGRSRAVSRNGPSTWEATVLSMPSAFSVRSALSAPALWMRVSRSPCEAITVSASAVTAARSPRSAYRGVWVAPVGEGRAAQAASVLAGLRPTTSSVAPSPARRWAAARPRPDVAPVSRMVRPVRSKSSRSVQCSVRERTIAPMRVKLGAIGVSRTRSSSFALMRLRLRRGPG